MFRLTLFVAEGICTRGSIYLLPLFSAFFDCHISLLASATEYPSLSSNGPVADYIRLSYQLAREVLDIAFAAVRPGITTDTIDAIVHDAIIERNAYPSPLNYRNFPKSVCTCVFDICMSSY